MDKKDNIIVELVWRHPAGGDAEKALGWFRGVARAAITSLGAARWPDRGRSARAAGVRAGGRKDYNLKGGRWTEDQYGGVRDDARVCLDACGRGRRSNGDCVRRRTDLDPCMICSGWLPGSGGHV